MSFAGVAIRPGFAQHFTKEVGLAVSAFEQIRSEFHMPRISRRGFHLQAGDVSALKADVITLGNMLHDRDEEKKITLMRKAYDALPAGVAFVAIERVIDNDRRQNGFSLMMSLNMLIETSDGFDHSFADFERWAKPAGFTRTALIPVAGPTRTAVAYK